MKRYVYYALLLCVGFVFVASCFQQFSIGQTRQQPNKGRPPRQAKPTPTPTPDPLVKEREAVETAIVEACAKLAKVIVDANGTYKDPPFDSLTPADDFATTCKTDGTISWTAKRSGGYGGDPDTTEYTETITLKVTDLTLGDMRSTKGTVELRTAEKKIYVSGPKKIEGVLVNQNSQEKEAWIALREEGDLTKDFKEGIRALVQKLGERARLAAAVKD